MHENLCKIFSTKPVDIRHSPIRMRLGAQTGTPPGVHEKSAVNLRQAAFYRHSIGHNAYPAADSHVFRSQALTDGSKPALNFPGKSDTRFAMRRIMPLIAA